MVFHFKIRLAILFALIIVKLYYIIMINEKMIFFQIYNDFFYDFLYIFNLDN